MGFRCFAHFVALVIGLLDFIMSWELADMVVFCSDYLPDVAKIKIAPGKYAVFSLVKGLDSITNEWEDADDFYKIILWPSSSEEYKVLKSYENT